MSPLIWRGWPGTSCESAERAPQFGRSVVPRGVLQVRRPKVDGRKLTPIVDFDDLAGDVGTRG